ncbi:MAG: hypothetical protein PHU46_09015 [Rhodocyclaceae bacterium]|nr:hypothetical protein [Rhodocyclaceae bacterium]
MNTTKPWHDPVVAEVHAARELLAEQYHSDFMAYSEAAVAHCHALGLNMAEDQHQITQFTQQVLESTLPAQQGAEPRSRRSLDAAR